MTNLCIKDLYLNSIEKRYKNCSFENYKINVNNKKAFSVCKNFCDKIEDYIDNGKNIFIGGLVGVGKTHLCYSIKRELIFKKNIPSFEIVITTSKKYIDNVRSFYNKKIKIGVLKKDEFLKCKILIIDEIGIMFNTDAERIELFDLFDYRYRNQLPTIVMGNLKKEDIKILLRSRISSRLFGNCESIYIKDSDFRKNLTR